MSLKCSSRFNPRRAILASALTLLVALFPPARTLPAAESPPAALHNAHAHNDYLHPNPLLDALGHGFGSVEADIHLVQGQLLVAHDLEKVQPGITLQSLYLDPLRTRVLRNRDRVHPGRKGFILLIDLKSEAGATYAVLEDLLPRYQDILTRFEVDRTVTNAVTIILSGNRPTARVAAQPVRFASIDGRLADLESNPSPHLIPLISDNWGHHFAWRGEGPMPESDRTRLREVTRLIHSQGRMARFWAAPDMPDGWRELQAAGVDLINTDQLDGLRDFLLRQTSSARP